MADNRIAYGLAKKYGIDTANMSPKQVWEALKKKGVTEENISKDAYDSKDNGAKNRVKNVAEKISDKKIKDKKDFSKSFLSNEDFRQLYSPNLKWDNFYIEDKKGYDQGEIVGVLRKSTMSFSEADNNAVNKHFDEDKAYQINCQSCVAVFEARLRGYNLEVLPFDRNNTLSMQLAHKPELAYYDAKPFKVSLSRVSPDGRDYEVTLSRALSEIIKENERFNLVYDWVDSYSGQSGRHIVECHKKDGDLKIYDPQTNCLYNESDINNIIGSRSTGYYVFRVDNLLFNKNYISQISKEKT